MKKNIENALFFTAIYVILFLVILFLGLADTLMTLNF
jgi:hypothetical protein